MASSRAGASQPNAVHKPSKPNAFVDLTEDTDDDEPVTSSTRQRLNGGAMSNPARKSGQSTGKSSASRNGTPSKQAQARRETIDLSPDRITSKGTTSKSDHVTETIAKAQSSRASQSSQPFHTRKLGEKKQKLPISTTSQKEAIILSDDGEVAQPLPAKFRIPPGMKDMSLRQATPSNPSLGSVHDAFPTGRSKRANDDENASSLPAKKQRLTQSFNDRRSTPGSDGISRGDSETGPERRHDPLNGAVQKPNGRDASGNGKSDLFSPRRNKKEPRLSDPRASNGVTLTGESVMSKRLRKGSPRSDVEDEQSPPRVQRDSPSVDSQGLRRQPEISPKESYDGDDAAHSSDVSGGQISRRDASQRIRKSTAKAQALSDSKKSKSQSGVANQSPASQDQGNDARNSDRSKPNLAGNESIETPVKHKSAESAAQAEKNRPVAQSQKESSRKSQVVRNSPDLDELTRSSLSSGATNKNFDTPLKSKESGSTEVNSQGSSSSLSNGATVQAKEKQFTTNSASRPATNKDVSSEADMTSPRVRRSEKILPNGSKNATQGTSSVSEQMPPAGSKTSKRTEARVSSAESNTHDTAAKEATILADQADLQLRSEAMKSDDQTTVTTELKKSFAVPKAAASTMKPPSTYSRGLPLATQVEKVLGKYLEELGDDNEYWTSILMNRARLAKEQDPASASNPSSDPENGHHDQPTSFASLKPYRLSPHQKGNAFVKSDQLWGFEKLNYTGRGAGPIWMSSVYTTFASDVPDVPSYAHYVSIKNNILAPNVTKLICWPYFGDEFDVNPLTNLREQYHLDIVDRERKLVLLLKAQKYEEYVESALEDLGCSWADVLRFLLESHPDVGSSPDAIKALSNRHEFCEHDFSRISERWRSILTELPSSEPEKLARAAVLCDNFQKLAKFSLWHVARRSEYAKLAEEVEGEEKAQPSDNELTCRICLRFNCPYHGELKETPDSESDDDSVSVVDSVVATDIVQPPRVNYRTRVAIPPPCTTNTGADEPPTSRSDKKDPKYWNPKEFNNLPDERGPFYPCHHPGISCIDAKCSCFENSLPCEKICSCAPDCKRKFQGCSCSTARFRKGTRGPCFEDDRCACYQSGRECDPDLCGDCGACEVVDPVNKHDDNILLGRCRNCSIQRGLPKQTLLGDSGVHGLGLYACEEIREHDFVGEYKGEIITKEEAERRGAVYEIQKLSYLFSLNATQEIDSTNFGNKVRFINHAKHKANLYPRIIMVNTVHRIALYASCTIRPGQELLFDYGPKFPDDQLGGKKSKKSAPHVRNAELVRNFLEVEESEDEVGNMRAKGVSHATSARNKARSRKPRGGARPNAGRKPRIRRGYEETASTGGFTEQDAGERLAAFNISDEVRSDLMDVDVEPGAEEDDDYELDDGSESGDSYDSEPSEKSEFDVEDEDEDDLALGVNRPGRGGVSTRSGR